MIVCCFLWYLSEVWFRCSLFLLLLLVVEMQYDQQPLNSKESLRAGVIRSEHPVNSSFPKNNFVRVSQPQSWTTFKLISNSSYLVGRVIKIDSGSESRNFSSELHSSVSLELSRDYFGVVADPIDEHDLPLFSLQFQGGNVHISHIVCDFMSMLMTENYSNALQQFFRTAMIFLNTFFIDILNSLQICCESIMLQFRVHCCVYWSDECRGVF